MCIPRKTIEHCSIKRVGLCVDSTTNGSLQKLKSVIGTVKYVLKTKQFWNVRNRGFSNFVLTACFVQLNTTTAYKSLFRSLDHVIV